MTLQEIVLATLKDLRVKMRGRAEQLDPQMVAEFRLLAETAYKLEDMGRVDALAAKLQELENRFNLSRLPAAPEAGQAQARKTPRLM